MAVLLARVDILRHRGAAAAHELRVTFKAAVELMQVSDIGWAVPQLGLVRHPSRAHLSCMGKSPGCSLTLRLKPGSLPAQLSSSSQHCPWPMHFCSLRVDTVHL